MKEYRALIQRLQALEDALELDEAVETATGFREYAEIRAELQKDKNLFEERDDLHHEIADENIAITEEDETLNRALYGDSP